MGRADRGSASDCANWLLHPPRLHTTWGYPRTRGVAGHGHDRSNKGELFARAGAVPSPGSKLAYRHGPRWRISDGARARPCTALETIAQAHFETIKSPCPSPDASGLVYRRKNVRGDGCYPAQSTESSDPVQETRNCTTSRASSSATFHSPYI